MNKKISLILILLILFLISACQQSISQDIAIHKLKNHAASSKQELHRHFFSEGEIIPLQVDKHSFQSITEWYDQKSFLYVQGVDNGAHIYRYNPFTGEKTLFFDSDNQIVAIQANKNQSLFIVHTAVNQYNSELLVLTKKGDVLFEWQSESNHLVIEWNPYSLSVFYVAAFKPDWSFETFSIDAASNKVSVLQLNQPFLQWYDESSFSFLKWDSSSPSLVAPLMKSNMKGSIEELIFDSIVSYFVDEDFIMTISNVNEEEETSTYSFYDKKSMKQLFSFTVPVLSMYSEWFVPNFQYNDTTQKFYTLVPIVGGMYDTYNSGFRLMSYSIPTGQSTVIQQRVPYAPFDISPDGSYCLYGYQTESIIDITKRQMWDLIKM
ncbi:hypothetical protein EJF36_13660 [Bacillus sp. HMF5848]|uniref:YqgU-like beta propeller domain-containing protein n=1 Tax=Bacillus sp. HMF5848 TaxID=2495421 RepID=UPI000F77BB55|nr:hypothetical protein [Bacillus sp. HMF5848]RSK27838.1 hypothetical protein EJF36_13660 [Bacillus sp. HMF5848]